jgi:hypothetical protein
MHLIQLTVSVTALLLSRSILVRGGRVCTIRNSRGDDEMAACGQLGDVGGGAALAGRPALPRMLEPPPRFRAILNAQQQVQWGGVAPQAPTDTMPKMARACSCD